MKLVEVRGEDFCLYEAFTLPLFKQGLVWVGGTNKDSEGATNNGCGKTTLFKAVTWCCWGESIDGENGDRVIRDGAKSAWVETELAEPSGDRWVVRRERRRGSVKLRLFQPSGDELKESRNQLQERINALIGMDFTAFKNTVLYGQNDSARFANPNTKDGERKDMLHKILRTSVLKDCHGWVRDKAKEIRESVSDIEGRMGEVRSRMDEWDVSVIQKRFDNWQDNQDGLLDEQIARAREHKRRAESESSDANQVSDLKEQIRVLKKSADKLGARQEVLDGEQSKFNKLRAEIDGIDLRRHEAEVCLDQSGASLDRLNSDLCPVCTTPLSEGVAGEYVSELKEEHKRIQEVVDEYRDSATRIETEQVRPAHAELVKATAQVEASEEARGEMSDINAELAGLAEKSASMDGYLKLARQAIANAKKLKEEKNPHELNLKEAKGRIALYKKQLKTIRKERDELSAELGHYEFWVRGFSAQGLPSFVLDGIMPYITERANHYLETLADGDIILEFNTQRELKSSKGEYRDEIDISWSVEGVEGYPPSGGQWKKIEIATDLALMDLVATREGVNIDILMLDEVLDGLDAEGKQRIIHLLHELRSRRGTIFVISHESDVHEIFERSVHVTKEYGVSRLEAA